MPILLCRTLGVFDADLDRAKKYCAKFNLKHHFIDITFDDYKEFNPIVMRYKFAPISSFEAHVYKAAIMTKKMRCS